LLLINNRFLGAAPRAFERAAGPSLPIFKSKKYISDERFSFEKLQTQRLPFLKAGYDLFGGLEELSANSQAFGA
jgi:hypothetical protein